MAFTSVSLFPVAVGVLMSSDHRLVHCPLMITWPCILRPSGQWRALVFHQPIITVKSGGRFQILSVQEGGIS